MKRGSGGIPLDVLHLGMEAHLWHDDDGGVQWEVHKAPGLHGIWNRLRYRLWGDYGVPSWPKRWREY